MRSTFAALMFLANVLFANPVVAAVEDYPKDYYPKHFVPDDDNSTPESTPTPERAVTPENPTPAIRPSDEGQAKTEPTPNAELVKAIVDKIADKILGSIFGVNLSTLGKVSEANDQSEAVSTIAESVVSNVLERIIPAAGWLDIVLESTPTGADDGILGSPVPSDKGKKEGQNLPPPK